MTDFLLSPLDQELASIDLVEGVCTDHPIGPLTTYRVGGTAARFVRPINPDEIKRVAAAVAVARANGNDIPVLVVGRGSNLLVADSGFGGLAVQLGSGFDSVDIDGVEVHAGGGASLPVIARQSVAAGLSGFEWAVGVPGSVGGAIRMNAGGHGSDMATSLIGASTLDLATGIGQSRSVGDLAFSYRSSILLPTEVVTSVKLRLELGHRSTCEKRIEDLVRWRRLNQPGGRNAGSVFTNPSGDSAGRLIDAAGGRGLRVGTAEVSQKHANFIQVDEGGSAHDVVLLMAEIVRLVGHVHEVQLEPETILVGF
ncbi:MAG: UDP-N-acetylmuramate dehydrogenase [Acidimicrobiales bacterium]|nr:UDP-N-acetylmuramate dehydrogenase [Acidimicrobiales bacterium]